MPPVKTGFWITVKEYSIILVGILSYVLGWILFLIPNNMIGGGVTGFASIIQYATGGFIKAGYTYFVVNVILLIAALFTLGKAFGGKTVFAVIVASVTLNIGQDIFPQDIIDILALQNGKLMCTIMGGILSGVGIGLAMSQGGSTGGTDIVALIVNKYKNVSPGRMILAIDTVIISSSLIFPSYLPDGSLMPWADKITTAVYGLILCVATSTTLDFFLSGTRSSIQLFIFSKDYEKIADAVTRELNRGVTVLNGTGWYSRKESHVVMVVTRKADMNVFLKYIYSIDPDAFISVASVTGVYGKGFDTFRSSPKDSRKEKNLPEK